MIGGSTDLQKGSGYYSGDLSGISAKKVPFWFAPFYKPGKKIAKTKDWDKKIEEVVKQAPHWDIGFIVGVPAWIQLCIERIIERYHLTNIHELWPNLGFYVHGGVSFEPYKKGFEKLLGRPITYIETYLASEGFIAYQDRQYTNSMRLVTAEHLYLEFIPVGEKNFDNDGNLRENPEVYLIGQVEENRDYAILLSTTAGAWRYLIGDTVQFTDKKRCEIIITGRIKHYLNLVGEHLSIDNMNKAVQAAAEKFNISIPEFTVAGISHGMFFAHQWYIATNDPVDTDMLQKKIDEKLKTLNDDYAVERTSALKAIYVKVLPESAFMKFLQEKGKVGGQHKFPRVLKGEILSDWQKFLVAEKY
jgi:hypothetical protein